MSAKRFCWLCGGGLWGNRGRYLGLIGEHEEASS